MFDFYVTSCNFWLLLGVEDAVYITIEFHHNWEQENNEKNNVTFTVSSTPIKSPTFVKLTFMV